MSTRGRRQHDDADEILESPVRALLYFKAELPKSEKKGTRTATKWKPQRRIKAWMKHSTKQPWFVVDKWDGSKYIETGQGWCLQMSDIQSIERVDLPPHEALSFLISNKKTKRHGGIAFALHTSGKTTWLCAARSTEEREAWLAWIMTFAMHMNLATSRRPATPPEAPPPDVPPGAFYRTFRERGVAGVGAASPGGESGSLSTLRSLLRPSQPPSLRAPRPAALDVEKYRETLRAGREQADRVSRGAARTGGPMYAGETRVDGLDGREYNFDEFCRYYGPDVAAEKWARSAMAPYGSAGAAPGSNYPERNRVIPALDGRSPRYTPPSPPPPAAYRATPPVDRSRRKVSFADMSFADGSYLPAASSISGGIPVSQRF